MKKKLLLLFLPILLLTGCNNTSNGVIPEKEREKINITLDNYSKYIAVYTISDSFGADYTYSNYRYQFIGSTLCKFNDCSLEYAFAKDNGSISETKYTVDLTISGCGETKEVEFVHAQRSNTYYRLKILSVNGTVELLY